MNHLLFTSHKPKATFVRGQGDYLFDQQNNAYLDLVQGWAVNTLGHQAPEVVQALQKAALFNPGPAYFNEPAVTLAEQLAKASGLERVQFLNSGAEANEAAIKLARKYGQQHKQGAYEIITFKGGFHGRTLATMSACGKPQFESLFEPKVAGFLKADLNDIESVKSLLSERTCAILVEPIQGEAGVIPAQINFMHALRSLCDEHGLLLMLDEVQTGIGRTGQLFAFESLGIKPDVVTLGKGLGSGVPISALLCHSDLDLFEPGDQGSTFGGNALMCQVAQAVVTRVQEDGFLQQVQQKGHVAKQQFAAWQAEGLITSFRGAGLLWAVQLPNPNADQCVAQAFSQGLLIQAPRENLIRLMPALNIEMEHWLHGLQSIQALFTSIRQN